MTIIRNVQLGCETVPVLRDTRPTENETNRARDNTIIPVLYISRKKKNTIVPVPDLIHHFFRSHLRSHHSRSLFAPFTGSDFPPKSRQVRGGRVVPPPSRLHSLMVTKTRQYLVPRTSVLFARHWASSHASRRRASEGTTVGRHLLMPETLSRTAAGGKL